MPPPATAAHGQPAAAPEPVWFANLDATDREELFSSRGAALLPGPEVLIVGGGVVGLAIAYFLADQGARVQLIEAATLASGASGANFGGIWPNDQAPAYAESFQALAFLSRDLWGRLSLRPDFDFHWRVNGLLNVNTARFAPSAADFAARAQERGCAVQSVDALQIARLEPHLQPGFQAGLHYPSEASLHPVKAVLSLMRAARRKGARIAAGVCAHGLQLAAGRVTAVETSAGVIEADTIVCCTGWNADWLAKAISLKLPVRPVSGQMIATDPVRPLLKSSVLGQYLVIQLPTGEIVTGGNTAENSGLVPDRELTADFAAAAYDLLPELAGTPFTRAWCGIRPATPDGLPILDRARGAANLWLACGHFKNGMLLAPATGKLMSDWIVRGAPSLDLAPFRADRFGHSV